MWSYTTFYKIVVQYIPIQPFWFLKRCDWGALIHSTTTIKLGNNPPWGEYDIKQTLIIQIVVAKRGFHELHTNDNYGILAWQRSGKRNKYM